MKIDLDHFKSIEELQRDVKSWVEEDDIYSLGRYMNNEDLLIIVNLLKDRTQTLQEIKEYIENLSNEMSVKTYQTLEDMISKGLE